MTAPHDTPEAVEAMTDVLENVRLMGIEDLLLDAAAMLRRLHKRAVDAEWELDGANALVERMHAQDVLAIQAWQKAHPGEGPIWPSSIRLSAWCMGEVSNLRSALATARADALREAAATRMQCNTAFEMYCAILALINQPNSTGET